MKTAFSKALSFQLIFGGILILIKSGQSLLFARLVIPEEFGVFITSCLIVNLFSLLGNFGLQNFIIKEKTHLNQAIGGSFVITFLTNCFLFLTLIALSGLFEQLFACPGLGYFLIILSPVVFMNVILVLNSQWERQMKFEIIKLMQIFGLLVTVFTTLVSFFVFNLGLYSLFYGSLSGFFVLLLLSIILLPQKQALFVYDKNVIKEAFFFGAPLLMSSVLGFVVLKWDDFAVRLFWGDSALAFYTVAFYFPLFSLEVVELINKVLFVSFTKVTSSKQKMVFLFNKSNKYIAMIVVPLGVVVSVFSPQIINFLFGEAWLSAVPLMQIFAISFILRGSIGYSWSLIPISKGDTKIVLLGSIGNVLLMIVFGTIVIYYFGVMGGVIINLLILLFWAIPFRCYVIKREFGNLNFLKEGIVPLFAGVLMYLFSFLFLSEINNPLALAFSILISLIFYVAVLAVLDRKAIVTDLRLAGFR